MREMFYQARRLLASHLFEAGMRGLSWWGLSRGPYRLIVWVGAAMLLVGAAFALAPAQMAAGLDFRQLSPVALGDIRAYYGTFLLAMGGLLLWLAGHAAWRRVGFLLVVAFSWGSASGRLLGFALDLPLWSAHGALAAVELALGALAWRAYRRTPRPRRARPLPSLNPQRPEDCQPLGQANFRDPYPYYRLLRDRFPVYRLEGSDFYSISRYEDIVALARDTGTCSSHLTETLVRGKPRAAGAAAFNPVELLGRWGVLPVDVLALQDPPVHTQERKLAHAGLNAHFVKALEPEVERLCEEMMEAFLARGEVEFMQAFAWKLPMRLIMRIIGLPEADLEPIKRWCMDGIRQLSGTATRAQSLATACSAAQFMRYLWRHYRAARRNPGDNYLGLLARQAADPATAMTDVMAVSTLFQLLIAGSDSSASTMGNAVRVLAERPDIEQQLRREPQRIGDFIEEVFRTEAAFQGHFRLTTRELSLHGVTIPANSRVFLLWASGNRDERFWERPEQFDMDRPNLRKHLTFGHGVHACLGRELARMEIRVVIGRLLARTRRFAIAGETPFEASLFARTLLALPLVFEPAPASDYNGPQSGQQSDDACPSQKRNPCPASA